MIAESKKIRQERGEDFFENKRSINVTDTAKNDADEKVASKIQANDVSFDSEKDFRFIRDSHVKLNQLIVEYDQKIFDQNNQVLTKKKKRSKTIHLYVDEKIESFLKAESKKAHTHWGLRKNAGLGNLIQKFVENFIELKSREERQLKRIKKGIEDFKIQLVEFKKFSKNPDEYQLAEKANLKLKTISNDLSILLTVYEFEEATLRKLLGEDGFNWLEFSLKWRINF